MTKLRPLLFSLFFFSFSATSGQENKLLVNSDWDHEKHSWDAHWITHPTASSIEYGVFLFRNKIELDQLPDSLVLHVSADMRYKFFVNGQMVSTGPAKGSYKFWRYESLDVGPYLKTGTNILAVEVFNLGIHKPVAIFSRQTAFILQAEGALRDLNTPGNWKVVQNQAYRPIPVSGEDVGGYYVAGPTDSIRAGLFPWGWKEDNFDDDSWLQPRSLGKGTGRGYMHGVNWMLIPRNIPLLESHKTRFAGIARSSEPDIPDAFLRSEGDLLIPSNSEWSILLDQSELTVGYPTIRCSGGEGSTLKISYAEALRDAEGTKGNRNELAGKELIGYHDVFLPDGGELREFQPLWLRTWRYVQLDIQTRNEPLVIHDFFGIYQAYPFDQKGAFRSSDPLHDLIWEAGWRTARLCAGETYMDCPYYEQLQYLGDTRIQSLISLHVSGDDRLMRNALELADQSRMPDGLTLSRGPSFIPQIIPAFSLYWVDMIHDYYMYREDENFLKQFLPGMEGVLDWFERRIDSTGMLGPLEWFNFADWTDGFLVGVSPGADLGHSALVSLNYVYALTRAAELFEYFGKNIQAQIYRAHAERTRQAVYKLCYNQDRKLLADIPVSESFQLEHYPSGVYSQHTNIWAILCDAVPRAEQEALMQQILSDTTLTQTTIYFRFYLFQALQKLGMGDYYTQELDPWKEMLDKGLTTFEEGDYEERSDCHAWSASPLYDFLATLAGITPAEPGFKSVSIAPALGDLEDIQAKMPHPYGLIELRLQRKGKKGIKGNIILPEGLYGTFKWGGQQVHLEPGAQEIKLN
jgi:hypothetical protein